MEGFYLVLTAPSQNLVDEYHSWYDDCHLPDIMDVPAVAFARRFALRRQYSAAQLPPFAAVYGLGDIEAAIAEIVARRGTEKLRSSDAINRALTRSACFEAPLGQLREILSCPTIALSLFERGEQPSASLNATRRTSSDWTAAVYAPASQVQTGAHPIRCQAIELQGCAFPGEESSSCSTIAGVDFVYAMAIGQLLSKT